MKKLLVLALVLGMASMANATLLELRVGGTAVVTVAPGAITGISITNNSDISSGVNEGYFILVAQTTSTFDFASAAAFNTDCFLDGSGLGPENLGVEHPAGTEGAYLGIFNFGATYTAGTTMFSSIGITGALGDTITIYAMMTGDDGNKMIQPAQIVDQITIIPEPMTMALLGLGGLFLRRRK